MIKTGEQLAPHSMDKLHLHAGFEWQRTNERKPENAPDNLFHPIGIGNRESGDFTNQTMPKSIWTCWERHLVREKKPKGEKTKEHLDMLGAPPFDGQPYRGGCARRLSFGGFAPPKLTEMAAEAAMTEDAAARQTVVDKFLAHTSWDITWARMSELIENAIADGRATAAATASRNLKQRAAGAESTAVNFSVAS
jgi:hypothetical protein